MISIISAGEDPIISSGIGMNVIKPGSREGKGPTRHSHVLCVSESQTPDRGPDPYRIVSECKSLIKAFPKEEIRRILRKNIGSRNMPKLSAMMEFLEIERGRSISEEFIKNVILLSLLYGSGRGKRNMAFAELVFQALYKTLSAPGSNK